MKTITMTFALTLLVGLLVLPILAQAVEEGLVAYWAFEETEGDTASDLSGNGHDGTLMGNPQRVDGYFGGALEFDGDGDEVNVPFHEDLNQETFTISAWANVEPESANHRAVVSSRDDGPQRGYIFYATPQNTWQFWTGDGGWKSVQGPAVTPGEWQHIAGTYVDGTQKFYVNGEFVGETASVPNLNTSQELLIGAGANERAAHDYLFKGMIDEVRVYDRALNEDEIITVMESNPTAVEASGKIAVTWGQLKAR
jgi:hypothetical protein